MANRFIGSGAGSSAKIEQSNLFFHGYAQRYRLGANPRSILVNAVEIPKRP
jgi:hypothetical protein